MHQNGEASYTYPDPYGNNNIVIDSRETMEKVIATKVYSGSQAFEVAMCYVRYLEGKLALSNSKPLAASKE